MSMSSSSTNFNIQEATTPEKILACWPPMYQLRPHLIKSEFVGRVQAQHVDEGYHLMYIEAQYDNGGVKVTGPVAILGYRVQNYLWSGKTMYIDDFCTLVAGQRRGFGGALLDWAKGKAKELGCACVSLDSGYTRNDAHRQYLNKGFKLASHHFHVDL